jgi:hypothetical protein
VTRSVGGYAVQMSELAAHYEALGRELETELAAFATVSPVWNDPTHDTDGPIFTRHLHEIWSDQTTWP